MVAPLLACLLILTARAAIIDRTSIVVGTHVIKSSDIDKEIRITSFLNNQPVDSSNGARKQAASRLIDQELIREQIRSGKYPIAPANEADSLLAQLRKDRFANDSAYKQALARYGIAEQELKDRLAWQLTVLRFIDVRFRPAVVVSDEETKAFYDSHRSEFRQATSLDEARPEVEQMITGERINKLLDDWLAEARKQTRIEYLEKSLSE